MKAAKGERSKIISTVPTLNESVRAAIMILSERRQEGKNITYGALGQLIGRHHRTLTPILDHIGAWCYSVGKESLAMLVVSKSDGLPGWGFFETSPGDRNPVTRKNYRSPPAETLRRGLVAREGSTEREGRRRGLREIRARLTRRSSAVIASEAKQSRAACARLLRRFAPRNDKGS